MNIKIKGIINYTLYDENNNILQQDVVENLVTNVGMDAILKCLTGEISTGLVDRFAVGTDDTPQSVLDTQLANKLLHLDVIGTKNNNSLNFNLNLPKNSVTEATWIRELGLVHWNGTSEILITRVALSSAKAFFITPNNTLSLFYQISLTN